MKKAAILAIGWFFATIVPVTAQESGYQVIDGTRVHTTINRSRGVAIFRNECGTQELTQRQLQQGAKPYDIIPCPRPEAPAPEPTGPSREELEAEARAQASRERQEKANREFIEMDRAECKKLHSEVMSGYTDDKLNNPVSDVEVNLYSLTESRENSTLESLERTCTRAGETRLLQAARNRITTWRRKRDAQMRSYNESKQRQSSSGTPSASCLGEGDASTSLDVTSRYHNGYHNYTITNTANCPVCFVLNDCEREPNGAKSCTDKDYKLGRKGSASGYMSNSNYRDEPSPKNMRFCK